MTTCTDDSLALNGILAGQITNASAMNLLASLSSGIDLQSFSAFTMMLPQLLNRTDEGSGEQDNSPPPPASSIPVLSQVSPWVDVQSVEECSRLVWWHAGSISRQSSSSSASTAASAEAFCDGPVSALDSAYGLRAKGWTPSFDTSATLASVCRATCSALGSQAAKDNGCKSTCSDTPLLLNHLVPASAAPVLPLVLPESQWPGCSAMPAMIAVAATPLGSAVLESFISGQASLTSLQAVLASFVDGGTAVQQLLGNFGLGSVGLGQLAGGLLPSQDQQSAALRSALGVINPDVPKLLDALVTAECDGSCSALVAKLCTLLTVDDLTSSMASFGMSASSPSSAALRSKLML